MALSLSMISHDAQAFNLISFAKNSLSVLKDKTPVLVAQIVNTIKIIKSQVETLKKNVPKVKNKKLSEKARLDALTAAVQGAARIETQVSVLINSIFSYVSFVGDKVVREFKKETADDIVKAMRDARGIVSAIDDFMQTIAEVIPDLSMTFMSL